MRRSSARIMADAKPTRWLGVNFWSRTGGPLMWRSYDPGIVREELRLLRAHGLTMTRSFFFWPDFMPEPDAVDEDLAVSGSTTQRRGSASWPGRSAGRWCWRNSGSAPASTCPTRPATAGRTAGRGTAG
jgi:hypothetical protein